MCLHAYSGGLAHRLPTLPPVDNRPGTCTCTNTRASWRRLIINMPALSIVVKRPWTCSCIRALESWGSTYRRYVLLAISTDLCWAMLHQHCLLLTTSPSCYACTHTRASLPTAYQHCLPSTTGHGPAPARIPGRAGAGKPALPPLGKRPRHVSARALAQDLLALRPIDDRLRLVSGERSHRLLALSPVDNRAPDVCSAPAFLENITQVLHAYLSELAQHLPMLPRARGRSWPNFVASHPDYAAGGSRLHKRTVRARTWSQD